MSAYKQNGKFYTVLLYMKQMTDEELNEPKIKVVYKSYTVWATTNNHKIINEYIWRTHYRKLLKLKKFYKIGSQVPKVKAIDE